MNLPCPVVRDLLPVYTEKLTEPETAALVEEHLRACPACRAVLTQAAEDVRPAETVQPLQNLKKQLRLRRLRTAAMAALAVLVLLATLVFRTDSLQPMAWEDGLVTVKGVRQIDPSDRFGKSFAVLGGEKAPHEYAGEAIVLQLDSRITGTQTETIIDEDGSETLYLQGMTRRSHAVRSGYEEYGEMVIYPVPERIVYGYGSEQMRLWGAPGTGGVQVLPRLALAYYVYIALIVLVVCALAWRLARKTRFCAFFRQLTFAPLCYLLSHLLLKGTQTVTFFLLADLACILLMAAALYALMTLGHQAWKQHTAR